MHRGYKYPNRHWFFEKRCTIKFSEEQEAENIILVLAILGSIEIQALAVYPDLSEPDSLKDESSLILAKIVWDKTPCLLSDADVADGNLFISVS